MKTNWLVRKLGEIADFQSGFALAKTKSTPQGVPHLRTFNINTSGKLNLSELIYIPEKLVSKNGFGLNKGDLLFNNTNSKELVGKSSIAEKDLPYAFSNHLTRLRVKDKETMPEWILLNLINMWLKGYFSHNSVKWIGQAGYSGEKLKKIEIPVPPIEEQKRIVKKLEKILSKLEQAEEQRIENLKHLHEIFLSYLQEIFHVVNNNWQQNSLKNLTSKIGSGATPLGGKSSYNTEGISLIRSLNVYDNGFRYKNLAHINVTQADRLSNVVLEKNDVLLNITGASIARCCVVPNEVLPARVNQHVAIIRPLQEKIISKFLHYLLISNAYKKRLINIGENKGATRQALTKNVIENLVISYPPSLIEQREIVENLDSLNEKVQTLQKLQQEQLQELEALKQSVLHQAFNGNL